MNFIKSNTKKYKQSKKTTPSLMLGFTIIELIVTVAIFVVITSLVLVKNNKFNSSVQLSNLAYEVALVIRQAQVFGISVRGTGADSFSAGYGIHFNASNNTSFVFFSDLDNNKKYDGANELIETLSTRGGNHVSSFCVVNNSNVETCSNSGSTLDITFKRPNPEATIKTNFGAENYRTAKIYISSSSGEQRIVSVQFVGQISVEQ